MKGEALLHLKHYEEAIASFEKVIDLDSSEIIADYKKGEALFRCDRYEESLTILKKAIKLFNEGAVTCKYFEGYSNKYSTMSHALYLDSVYSDACELFSSVVNNQEVLEILKLCYEQARADIYEGIEQIYASDQKEEYDLEKRVYSY